MLEAQFQSSGMGSTIHHEQFLGSDQPLCGGIEGVEAGISPFRRTYWIKAHKAVAHEGQSRHNVFSGDSLRHRWPGPANNAR